MSDNLTKEVIHKLAVIELYGLQDIRKEDYDSFFHGAKHASIERRIRELKGSERVKREIDVICAVERMERIMEEEDREEIRFFLLCAGVFTVLCSISYLLYTL